jgi:hypothetical protein
MDAGTDKEQLAHERPSMAFDGVFVDLNAISADLEVKVRYFVLAPALIAVTAWMKAAV